MDPQQQAFLSLLQQAAEVIQQARTEQGWTAGAVALVLVICILGLGWLVRRLSLQVDELSLWRTNLLQDQVQDTTRALTTSSAGLERFGARLDDAASAVKENTVAVHGLRETIQHAPCGMRLTSS